MSAAQTPPELTRLRILHETAEYLEQDADWHNTQATTPDQCERHPNGAPTCWHNATDEDLRKLGKAIHVSGGNILVCEALLRGETVPLSKLDPEWVRRLGRR